MSFSVSSERLQGPGTVVPTAGGPGIWAGAALLADDLALLARSLTELAAMFAIALMWARRHRFLVSYGKTKSVASGPRWRE